MSDFTRLIRSVFRGPREISRGAVGRSVVNPYRDEVPELDLPGAAPQRRRHLEAYLERVGRPEMVLLGEAFGYRGGRFSGIAFTGERQIAGPAAQRLPWASTPPFRPTSRHPQLWLEPSGSVVWGALGGEARGVLLWNAFPWHPPGAAGPLSNRTPERRLLLGNLHVLEELLAATAGARVLAVGRTAQTALSHLGVDAPLLRHPAYGGAGIFRGQLAACLGPLRPGRS